MSGNPFPVGKYAVPALMLAGLLYMLFKVHEILLPFVLGATLAYLISPLVRFFEVRGLRRQPVVFIVFGGLLALLAGGAYLAVNLAGQEAAKAAQELPRYVERGRYVLQDLHAWADKPDEGRGIQWGFVKRFVQDPIVMGRLHDRGRTLPGILLQKTSTVANQILPLMELLLLVPLIAFLLLLEGPALLENFLGLVSAHYVEMFLNIVFEIDNSMGNYVRGLCLKSFLVGLLSLAGFWMMGLDYSIQLAALSALTNVVPVIGPAATGLLAMAIAFFQWGTLGGLVKVLAVCAAIRLIDDGVLQVVVFKNSVEMHPIFIIFSLMAGGALWGFWGLLFGVPLACMLKVLLGVVWEWYRSEYGLLHAHPPAEASHLPLV